MTNLVPASSFDDVPRLETATLALGGPGGPMNLPAQALLNRTQWLHDNAVAGTAGPFGVDTGGLNACAVNFTPPITSIADGLKLRFTVSVTNTGAATFSPNGLTAKPILGGAQSALQGGELIGGGNAEIVYDSTLDAWVLVAQSGGAVQVADASESKQAVNNGQLVASVGQVIGDLASSDAGKGTDLVYDAAKASAVASALGNPDGFQQWGTGTALRTFQDKMREFVSVLDFGAAGNGTANDTTAFIKALATGKKVFVPEGTYAVAITALPNGTYMYGEGTKSVIKPYSNTQLGAISFIGTGTSDYIDGITIRDIRFLGSSVADGFSEQSHLIAFLGVKNVLIEGCTFEQFRGDGLYIGGSSSGGPVRHNANITVCKCLFDGVNNANRNGISVTDGTDILIEDCNFLNCSRSDMPGAVDIEPNYNDDIIDGITVRDCNIQNNLGTTNLCCRFRDAAYVQEPRGVCFDNNTISDSTHAIAAIHDRDVSGVPTMESPSNVVRIVGNTMSNITSTVILIEGVKGLTVSDNFISNCAGNVYIGSTHANATVVDGVVQNNRFVGMASGFASACTVYSVSHVDFNRNVFVDCTMGGTNAAAMYFTTGASDNITIRSCVVRDPNAKLTYATRLGSTHTATASTNLLADNRFDAQETFNAIGLNLSGQGVETTVGIAGGASSLPATPTGYLKVKISGTFRKIPFYAI